jgi:predicted O-methyltransferase YrrM
LLDREFYSEKFKLVLEEINNNLKKSEEALEGNYFYHHESQKLTPYPAPTRSAKRIFLAKHVQHKRYVLEVGVNAGHSALLILAANSKVKYLGVDIEQHGYTRSSSEILRKHFGERVEMIFGDSRDVLPTLKANNLKFDVIHIDGSHSYFQCLTDLRNSQELLLDKKSTIILDDIKAHEVLDAFNQFKSEFMVSRVKYSKTKENISFRLKRE